MQAIVGTKYQIVIPKAIRKKLPSLKPGAKVNLSLKDKETIHLTTSPLSWVERTSGMMTEAWKGVDPAAEIEKMRDGWDEKIK